MDTKAYKEKIKAKHYESNVIKGHIPPTLENLHIRTKNNLWSLIKRFINFVKNFFYEKQKEN